MSCASSRMGRVAERLTRTGHWDSAHAETSDPKKRVESMFTMHLYLNDAESEVEGAELVGGATAFYSGDFHSCDETRQLEVHPKAGRVLIFQHRGLHHSGEKVLAGTKYMMRTDLMYELVPEPPKRAEMPVDKNPLSKKQKKLLAEKKYTNGSPERGWF